MGCDSVGDIMRAALHFMGTRAQTQHDRLRGFPSPGTVPVTADCKEFRLAKPFRGHDKGGEDEITGRACNTSISQRRMR